MMKPLTMIRERVLLLPDQRKGSSTSAYVSSCRLVLLFHLWCGDAAGSCFGVIIIRLKSFHSAETGSQSGGDGTWRVMPFLSFPHPV